MLGLLAHPHRIRAAQIGLDVEAVLGAVGARGAQGPALTGLEECVLHILRDQPSDVPTSLWPLLGPPLSLRQGVLERVHGAGSGPLPGGEVGQHQGARDEYQVIHTHIVRRVT